MNPDQDGGLPARDPRFDAAWRHVSNEEPPSTLDDAIRAAARRELGAGPRASDVALREARRPERWWFPLTAAAAIGAIALGLLQIVGPDRLPVAGSPAVVSDILPGTTIPTPPAPASSASPAGLAVEGPPPAPHAPPAAPRPLALASRDAAAPVPAAERAASVPAPAAKLASDARERRRVEPETRPPGARTALPPAEWIALIRRLRDEGRTEEAARELAAFRAAHPDHETLLPPDLVRWRPDAR
jgi:hypothetical protein